VKNSFIYYAFEGHVNVGWEVTAGPGTPCWTDLGSPVGQPYATILYNLPTTCLNVTHTSVTFSIQVTTFSHPQLCCKTTSSQWLHHLLLPKLNKWASQPAAAVTKSVMSDSQETDGRSDELVSTEKYFEKYTRMKDVYGKAICEVSVFTYSSSSIVPPC